MSRRLLLLAAAVAVFSPVPAGSIYSESRYGSHYYYCRDRYGFVGDCRDWNPHQREDYDYGYRTNSRYGDKVGLGFYNMHGDQHAEMVCDFGRHSNVRDEVTVSTLVWLVGQTSSLDYLLLGSPLGLVSGLISEGKNKNV